METLGIQVPANPAYPLLKYPAFVTIADLLTAFHTAMGRPTANSTVCQTQGCTAVTLPNGNTTIFLPNATLPSANNSALNSTAWGGAGIKTDYNLVVWQGNNTAYLTCELPNRGPEYYGTCTNMAVTCLNNNNNDTIPYNCTRLSDGAPVTGSLSVVAYRSDCEFPCDLKQDCDAICDCTYVGGCNATQTCTCKACTDLNKVASADSQFVDITASATSVRGSVLRVRGHLGGVAARQGERRVRDWAPAVARVAACRRGAARRRSRTSRACRRRAGASCCSLPRTRSTRCCSA